MPFLRGRGLDEELHFHLLELARAENEVARGDLVAKALAYLADAEGRFLARGRHHVGEVDEDALRGLRTQIVQALLGLDRTQVGLEHHVEFAGLGPLPGLAGVGVTDVGQSVGRRVAVLGLVGLDEMVGAVTLMGDQRLDQRVMEDLDVARGHPHLPRQDDRRIQAHDVVAPADHRAPPLTFDVLFELHTQRAVVPRRPGSAVDLSRGKTKPRRLARFTTVSMTDATGWCTPFPGLGGRAWRPTAVRRASVMVAIGAAVFDMRHHACDSGVQPIRRILSHYLALLEVMPLP